jgi:hypothetical protein
MRECYNVGTLYLAITTLCLNSKIHRRQKVHENMPAKDVWSVLKRKEGKTQYIVILAVMGSLFLVPWFHLYHSLQVQRQRNEV